MDSPIAHLEILPFLPLGFFCFIIAVKGFFYLQKNDPDLIDVQLVVATEKPKVLVIALLTVAYSKLLQALGIICFSLVSSSAASISLRLLLTCTVSSNVILYFRRAK